VPWDGGDVRQCTVMMICDFWDKLKVWLFCFQIYQSFGSWRWVLCGALDFDAVARRLLFTLLLPMKDSR
jgi:hypothetical protein